MTEEMFDIMSQDVNLAFRGLIENYPECVEILEQEKAVLIARLKLDNTIANMHITIDETRKNLRKPI